MKSSDKPEISKKWWTSEKPDDIKGVDLEKSLGKAEKALEDEDKKSDERTIDDCLKALKDLESSYEKVLAEIKSQYHLGYTSTNTAQDGRWRKVEIKVKRPETRLRSRKGYFAAYKAPR